MMIARGWIRVDATTVRRARTITPLAVCALSIGLTVAATTSRFALGADWPCYRGPNHDGRSGETAFRRTWKEPPARLWSRQIGAGLSSLSISAGRIYTAGTADKQQCLYCLDAADGRIIWQRLIEDQMTDPDPNLHGPRATPTVDDGRVYMLGGQGRLICATAADGESIWEKKFRAMPHWGYAASVLIEGENAIVSPGGDDGALAAYDKKTGRVVWKCGSQEPAYAMPLPFDFGGRRLICCMMAHSALVAEADSGKAMLEIPWPSHSGVNAASPIYDDGKLFLTTGYGYGSALFELSPKGEGLAAREMWRSEDIGNKFQSSVLYEGNLYTSDERAMVCVDFLTGEPRWRRRRIKHSPLFIADGQIILLRETGELEIGPATPKGFEPTAAMKVFDGSTEGLMSKQGRRCWCMPVLVDGKLYVRDLDTVVCVDLRR